MLRAIATAPSFSDKRQPASQTDAGTLTDSTMSPAPTFYTLSDAGFFPGTVALLNSLRLTNNSGELVVLDNGLTGEQRRRLEGDTRVVDLPDAFDRQPWQPKPKPFPLHVGATGVVVLIDSDMIVTASLEAVIGLAQEGRICLFPDHEGDWGRWFPGWERWLSLASPLRRQIYLNSGFVAFSTDRWPWLLQRYWDALGSIPPEFFTKTRDSPFRDRDQDVLNAILMSEVEPDDVAVLPYKGEAYPDAENVVIEDESRLACTHDDEQLLIAHHSLGPKVWAADGWKRMATGHPYVRLFPRVVFGDDVTIRLTKQDVPWWLWPHPRYRTVMHGYFLARRMARPAVHRIRRFRSAADD